MSNHASSRRQPDSADRPEPAVPAGVETTEVYETEDGIVLYDAENPLAWVQATHAVRLSDVA
ncbi:MULTISPECIES: hypothetical protein [unclassified Haladaptatus]|uniref:DUF7331 family protein n=1 Tax=unclassified Haladaptatus TaxID=2622732 RepID=UPI0023E8BB77|nr:MULTISPECIES: hypothetical protein [unclassified Haladaptatus]